jgi:hypothetical protein
MGSGAAATASAVVRFSAIGLGCDWPEGTGIPSNRKGVSCVAANPVLP